MRIAIDARSLTTRPTGVGHYLLGAVNVWAAQKPDIEFLLLAHKPLHPSAAPALRQASNIRFLQQPGRALGSNGFVWLLAHFAPSARELGATHLWGAGGVLPPGGARGMATLLTVHDLVYRSLPWTMSLKSRIAHGLLAGLSIRRADTIWAVSRFTATEIERYYPRRRSRRLLVGAGLNPLRQQSKPTSGQVAEVAARYGVTDKTLLFVGTTEPRKNLAFLLSLMPTLAQGGVRLLVIGCAGWGPTRVSDIIGRDDFPRDAVRFCDYVPDTDLQALYRCAAFFISTALMEGFGLPHLEAMAAGCPVIAAANSAVVEVVSDGGVLVAGWDTDRWIAAIGEAFADVQGLRTAARRNAQRHAFDSVCVEVTRALSVRHAAQE
jgi:glycosyltransferase involved in cell wall biosynthesis